MKPEFRKENSDYEQLKNKLLMRFLCLGVIAMIIICAFYAFIWQGRGSEWVVSVFQRLFHIDYAYAVFVYQQTFRNYMEVIWIGAVAAVFFVLLRIVLNWFAGYFDLINQGIAAILDEGQDIRLPAEMAATERKLNAVKAELRQRTVEAQLAEQRKNDLVMYLAHDIRTPLTSVIGYLSLLEEAPDMPVELKAKYVHITLEKAYRLEQMVNEFFEITRYNLQQICITKESIDLYYMLVQLTDELSPILAEKGNGTVLQADENLRILGDPDKLARVFHNILKNAAAYSYPGTDILISAEEKQGAVVIRFQNKGKTIPQEKLRSIFERFYRLDEARTSNTGGAGLGLAIAKEIVTAHGGTIRAESEKETVTFMIALPDYVG